MNFIYLLIKNYFAIISDQGKYSWFENLAHSTISEPLRPRKDSSSVSLILI